MGSEPQPAQSPTLAGCVDARIGKVTRSSDVDLPIPRLPAAPSGLWTCRSRRSPKPSTVLAKELTPLVKQEDAQRSSAPRLLKPGVYDLLSQWFATLGETLTFTCCIRGS